MRKATRCFERETKVVRDRIMPTLEQRRLGHLIKCIVDFDTVQARCIVSKSFIGTEPDRVEVPLPFVDAESARPRKHVHTGNSRDYPVAGLAARRDSRGSAFLGGLAAAFLAAGVATSASGAGCACCWLG